MSQIDHIKQARAIVALAVMDFPALLPVFTRLDQEAKNMTQAEFDGFVDLARAMNRLGIWPKDVWVPSQNDLARGGIIGVAEIVDCVEASDSPWFFGPYGFVLRNARPVDFIPVRGALGLFDWTAKQ